MGVVIGYTDGSCDNKVKIGGTGVVLFFQNDKRQTIATLKDSNGPFKNTTSARMEIQAAIRALQLIQPTQKYQIKLYIDNQYVVKTIQCGWLDNWLTTGQQKKNMDLWAEFKQLYDQHGGIHIVELIWIRGHDGNKWNELADKLANQGRLKKSKK